MVTLDARDVVYLKNTTFLPLPLVQVLEAIALSPRTSHELLISPEMAEEYRSAFTLRLARVGFDADYGPTAEGRILEDLIDKFFIP